MRSSVTPPREQIVALTRALVREPSQASTDSLDGVLGVLGRWFEEAGLPVRELRDESGGIAGLVTTVESRRPGPVICLDACLDTAPAGDPDAWSVDPFGGEIRDGKLYGRGVADSKVAVAMFVHLARELSAGGLPAGTLHVLLDGDEHSGGFAGVKSFIEREGIRPDFAAIGYPGNDKLVIGARGFFRAVAIIRGAEGHSGSTRADTSQNAVAKAARLVEMLRATDMPFETSSGFEAGPRLTVTAIHGGSGFSQIPGRCEVNIDIRLTPSWTAAWAKDLVRNALLRLDREQPTAYRSVAREAESWPAYRLDSGSPPIKALRQAAEQNLGRSLQSAVAGPSNIGNYLACFGVPATCGFGVTYGGLHGADEWAELATVEPVYRAYRQAVDEWARTLTQRAPDEVRAAAVAEPVARTG